MTWDQVSQFGALFAIIVGIGFGFWHFSKYAAKNIIEPVRDKFLGTDTKPGVIDEHLRFLGEVANRVQELSVNSRVQAENMVELTKQFTNEESPFSTTRTNAAAAKLAQQIELLAMGSQSPNSKEIARLAREIEESFR